MSIPLATRIRSLLARDKDAFWWRHFTDEELALKRMDVWELAAVIEEAQVRAGMERKKIVAEHLLAVRLAQIQATASWGSGLLGFFGAIIGAALTVALTSVLSETPARPCAPVAASLVPSTHGAGQSAPSTTASATSVQPSAAAPTGAASKASASGG